MIHAGLGVKMMKWVPCLAAIGLIAIGASCNRNDGLASVTGSVQFRGTPLTEGQVVFTPQAGTTGAPAVGNIAADGTFAVKTAGRDGAVVGQHRVTVHARQKLTEEESRNLVVPKSLIPEKYSQQDQSPLTYDVQAGPNEFRIELE